ncbi:polyphosphate kinase [Myxococcus sp. SDU36]|uniref:polyphosphate kinase 2 family protein n=1 Tax=Myxococcus sp. SDU36 TaxID=2831967 RepID=UPI0025430011|nr:polyphosphate kinase [Myxococcus sp. SDU36]
MTLAAVDPSVSAGESAKYEKTLKTLQERVFALQIQNYLAGRKAVVVFEGWDASGKGGAIRRLTTLMDPRGYKVWPISAPSEEERRHHYLWRFWRKTPGAGEVCMFDRSWYGRVLVERVEGFAKPAEWRRAYDEINAFEHMLTADGVRMVKFFIHIDKKTQLQRFREREADPAKRYKLGEEDWRNRAKWKRYEAAIQEMLDRTHRLDAPWHVVPGNDKRYARLEVLRRCVELLG